VVFLTDRFQPLPPLEPHGDNLLPSDLSPASLLEKTRAGHLVWKASEKGPVLLCGGRTIGGSQAGHDIWVALGRQGRKYTLTLTTGVEPIGEPVTQSDGWLRRCELGRLWRAIERASSRSQSA
jgi:hypothetical protein